MVGLSIAAPSSALALPGDPPIVPLSPADGASVPDNTNGITVSYRCPGYRKEVYGDPASPSVSRGDGSDYEVRTSASPALGSDGRLADQTFGSDQGAQPAADGMTCTSTLFGEDGSRDRLINSGPRVYWQAYRPCIGCEGQRAETGPVRSFVVRISVAAKLRVPRRLYAGYLNVFSVASKARLSGARVTLQRRVGRRWRKLVSESYNSDATELIASLPAGRQKIRAVISAGGSRFTVPSRTVTVRRGARRSTSRRDDGRYAAKKAPASSTLSFKVTGGGRTLRGFKASVTTFCFGQTVFDNRLFVVFAVLNKVRVAPDGSAVGVLRTKKGGREVLRGRLRHRRFVGEVSVGLSTCNGTRKITAVRR